MAITKEDLQKVPEPYKTFMQALWPVIRTDEDGSIVRVTGIPYHMIESIVADRHGYSQTQVQTLSQQLQARGWIEVDKFGFYRPAGQGIEALRAINHAEPVAAVPELPEF
ncbi:MAG: hypothetical protein SFV23_06040 [Planctomycetaceae bacterium]|nr:hypothetical protein [Planctomycetaceae bacterium]